MIAADESVYNPNAAGVDWCGTNDDELPEVSVVG